MITLVLFPLLISLPQLISSTQNKCVLSPANPQACMCNSTYCDDAAPVYWCQDEWYFHTYLTSENGNRLNHSVTYIRIPGKTKDANYSIIINPCKTYQKIIGFGGAMTDSAALSIACLSIKTRQNLMNSYFDCDSGIGYNLIRVPLGASDSSEKPYTYDDTLQPDPELKYFALNDMDKKYKIPLIRLANITSCKNIRLKAASWKAPKWMTKNETANVRNIFSSAMPFNLISSILPQVPEVFRKFNRTCIKAEYGKTYANYLYRALKEYSLLNLTISYLSGGDGVHYALMSDCWNQEEYKNWIVNDLCQTLRENGMNYVKILALDDQTPFLPGWQKILEDHSANLCIAGFATHWYLELIPGISLPIQKDFCSRYPDKIFINTESSICDYEPDFARTSDWEKARRYAVDIIDRLSTCNQGYIDFNLALNLQGGPNQYGFHCHSAIAVNCKADKFYKKILFYVLGHFSKFLPEGSVRVDAKIKSTKSSKLKALKSVAFKVNNAECSKNNLVVIVLNQNAVDLKINICTGREQCASVKMPKNSIMSTVSVIPSYFTCN